ncbi:MAG: LD-carboxypeptidase, partial [Gloeomargaritaceae cyanobacterium C42_A2020_066]|nr:LD-carboxypeptidase [Gloeomargaritaceae cyanobacterium C42_A2020_066]
MLLQPPTPGDRLRVVALSGPITDWEALTAGVALWEAEGYRVEVDVVREPWGYLAGRDADRRAALHRAWIDPNCAAILCARGGYGCARLLEGWVWPAGRPKWVIGFSDTTALLWSLWSQGIPSLHGPLITTLAQESDASRQRLWDAVAGRPLAPLQGTPWVSGQAEGWLLPANLTVATHLIGTPHLPSLEGAILALE